MAGTIYSKGKESQVLPSRPKIKMAGIIYSKGKGSQVLPSRPHFSTSFILFFISLLSLIQCTVAFTAPSPTSTKRTASFSLHSVTDSTAEEASQQILDETSSTSTPIFQLLASLACTTLYQSDLKRDAKGKGGGAQGSSATNWIDDASSFALKSTLDQMVLTSPDTLTHATRDETIAWLRWMKSTPVSLIVDLTNDLIHLADVNNYITEEMLSTIRNSSKKDFLSRIECKLILLPSGAELQFPLMEKTGSILFGKLLYGGVSRYRLLGSSTSNRAPRRVGEKTAIKSSADDVIPTWVQFGGSERKYQAVDMGSSAVLELTLSGRKEEANDADANDDSLGNYENIRKEMRLTRIHWDPIKMFDYASTETNTATNGESEETVDALSGNSAMNLGGKKRNDAFESSFKSSVGGLNKQIEVIVRRVLDGRVIRPVDEDSGSFIEEQMKNNLEDSLLTKTSGELSQAAFEADELALLGLTPVRGMLLYGPPGCGKTALAREISRALRARKPKIISAPELLDRWVGSSEKLIRGLFTDAEAELAACNGDATKSALHVIVIDEIDAVFRKRTSAEDSGEATRSSAVNQILAKLDGVNAINNVLLIGMTNRRELLDPALLRPGRLEVQIFVPKPDKEGRREVLNIHFDALRKKGRLSKPLCCAIDGVKFEGGVDENEIEAESFLDSSTRLRKRDKVKKVLKKVAKSPLPGSFYDLAQSTAGFSGADIAGLVRCAGSIALARTRKAGNSLDDLMITLGDVQLALKEVSL